MMRLTTRFSCVGLLLSILAGIGEAQVPTLVANIDQEATGSRADDFRAVGDFVLFTATDLAHGEELWVSDGTPGGGQLLADIYPGEFPSHIGFGPVWNGRLFFWADDRINGRELWSSDGTAAGTNMVVELVTDNRDSAAGAYLTGLPLGNHLVYLTRTNESVLELWRTDGTATGSERIRIIADMGTTTGLEMVPLGDGAIFLADADPALPGKGVWRTDGTAAGTELILPETPGRSTKVVSGLSRLGARWCWIVDESGDDRIWCTDGTAAGTAELHDVPGDRSIIQRMVSNGTQLLFSSSTDFGQPPALWVSDGTPGGARVLLPAGTVGAIEQTIASGPLVYFIADDANGRELWRTDGTADGTFPLDLTPGPGGSAVQLLRPLDDGKLAFVANDGVSGSEPWVTDGTIAGTQLLADIAAGSAGSRPTGLTHTGGALWFEASSRLDARELWKAEVAGPVASLGALVPGASEGSVPTSIVRFRDHWVFAASDGERGRELWVSDGTAAGTRLMVALAPGPIGSDPMGLQVIGDQLFFSADLPESGREPWVSDGTVDGTRLLRDIMPGTPTSRPDHLTAVGHRVFFVAGPNFLERTLWTSDGTSAGTREVFAEPAWGLVPFQDGLVFASAAGVWRIDPPLSEPRMILDLQVPPTIGAGLPNGLIFATSEQLFLATSNGGFRLDLWSSDGTEAGTDFLGTFRGELEEMTAVNGRVVFSGEDAQGTYGRELWTSDGTADGTALLFDVRPGDAGSFPAQLTPVGGQVYYRTLSETGSPTLWRTDGTESGTHRVDRVASPRLLGDVGGQLLFTEQQLGEARSTLYITQGGADTTHAIGPAMWFGLGSITVEQGQGVLRADDGVRGSELWALETTCFFADTPLWLHEGRFRVDACWRRLDDTIGLGAPVAMTEETGAFSFFNPANLDLAVKILDGRDSNGEWWFFFASLTNVEGRVRVTDTETGGYRDFVLEQGESKSFAAIDGFPAEQPVTASLLPADPVPVPPLPAGGGCDDGTNDLCVTQGRFRVAVRWQVGAQDGDGTGIRTEDNSGHFWFFRPENLELLVKIHDGRPANGHFWVFLGALSNLAFTVTVTDTATGAVKAYVNQQGDYKSEIDTRAFPG